MRRVTVDGGYPGVTHGTQTSSHFVSLSLQASCSTVRFTFTVENVQCLTVMSPRQCSQTQSKLWSVKLEEHISVSRVERVSRGGEREGL